MFLKLYGIYRTYSVDSTICFAILTAILYTLFQPKETYKKITPAGYLAVSSISFTVLFQGVLLFALKGDALIFSNPVHYFYYFLCLFSVAVLWSHILLRGRLYSKCLYALLCIAVMQIYRGICMPLYLRETEMDRTVYACWDLLTAAGLYLFLFLMLKMFRRSHYLRMKPIDYKDGTAMLYVIICLLVIATAPGYFPSVAVYVILAVLFTLIPVVFYLFSRIVNSYEEQRRMDQALSHALADQEAWHRSEQLRLEIRKERHEIKNRYFHLQVLARQKQYDELEKELERIIGTVSERLSGMDTGNTYLDYLLSCKQKDAKEKQIPMRLNIMLDRELNFDESAAGTVLSNLIDNAIEASAKEENPLITINMKTVQGYIYGEVVNHISRNIIQINPEFHTTKKDSDSHGYGLKIVRKTLADAGGTFDLEVKENSFCASFLLPITVSV